MKPLKMLVFSLFTILRFGGCAVDSTGETDSRAMISTPPMLGQSGSADAADRSCQVVLRQVTRDWSHELMEYEHVCHDDECSYVWRGTVDVSEHATGSVFVLYRLVPETTWYEIPTLEVTSRAPGFSTHAFVIASHVFGPETHGDNPPDIELVAFLRQEEGGRLFDHNVHAGDFDNTLLTTNNGFQDSAGFGVCQPVIGTLVFDSFHNTTEFGPRRQGHFLRVDYMLDRLPDCRGTHNGYPAWDINVHAKFQPGDRHVITSLRQPDTWSWGDDTLRSITLRIPEDATHVELWFENYTGAGSSCRDWDSNFGSNYVFDIWPAADNPRCMNVEKDNPRTHGRDWRFVFNEEHCVNYDLAEQFNANHCEFYLDEFGVGYEGHYGIPLRWVFAWLNVNYQDGHVVNAGMFTRFFNELAGTEEVMYSLGQELMPGRWRMGFTTEKVVYAGSLQPAVRARILEVAFFIDVRRNDGTVVRLWQSRQGQNHPADDIHQHLGDPQSIPYGNIRMVRQDSPLFTSRHFCLY